MDHRGGEREDECREALLHGDVSKEERQVVAAACRSLWRRVFEESKKLWVIVGPAIFTRSTNYSMNVIMQAFAGHLGDLELASVSFACTVLVGFNYGIMAGWPIRSWRPIQFWLDQICRLGMASALETLCGQAFGAKKFHMMGVYMQRSWIILFICTLLLLPLYFVAEDVLLLTGQPPEVAAMAGRVAIWFIPLHFSFAFLFPLQQFLQCQLKNSVVATTSAAALCFHVAITWLFFSWLQLGLASVALALSISWWLTTLMLFAYVTCGGCPDTWHGFSVEAFAGIWEFVKLSSASGVMLCLEHWYYRILIVLTGNLNDTAVAVDALTICMLINGCELMIPLAFFTGTGERVANELGAGNGSGARFAAIVSSTTSLLIGIFFCVLTIFFHDKIALVFTTSAAVLNAFDKLYVLLAFTILLNSIQPVLSGVAVGSAWQSKVAYINIGCYYLVGLPMGILLEWFFNLGVMGIWGGMIGGTAIQTIILAIITVHCDWEKEAMIASTRMHKLSQVR